MNDFEQLIQQIQSWPTMLTAKQEIELLNRLRHFDEILLLDRFEQLSQILSKLEESHAGGTLFEVTELNRPIFDAGALWIESLARPPLPETSIAFLRTVSETLRTRFPGS
jgi:hypothetical protein